MIILLPDTEETRAQLDTYKCLSEVKSCFDDGIAKCVFKYEPQEP